MNHKENEEKNREDMKPVTYISQRGIGKQNYQNYNSKPGGKCNNYNLVTDI